MNFREFLALTEAGKNPVDINWNKRKDRWEGSFYIKDIEYNIETYISDIEVDFDIWEFKFYKNRNETQITGDFKTHFIIVPTIQNAFEEFIKEKKPDCVLFLASDNSKSRKSLYNNISLDISSRYKYYSINPMLPKNDILFGICKSKNIVEQIKELIGF